MLALPERLQIVTSGVLGPEISGSGDVQRHVGLLNGQLDLDAVAEAEEVQFGCLALESLAVELQRVRFRVTSAAL